MFEQLFNEEGAGMSIDQASTFTNPAYREQLPSGSRLGCRLAGIENQGATCYLNSLLQTLVMTPEFRESLFELGPNELGTLINKDKQGAKVRVIPIQLQKLFCRLLLLDVQAASTTELTDSFGWTNSEELTQHDVQELNRILFTAIEDSLVGTPGQNIINKLYHGSLVNQIICEECSRVSEREEDFLDLCVSVSGSEGLLQSLSEAYEERELLHGNNQYRCEACQKLVNAKKGVKVRHLPPLLTISLLRFSFDYVKMERYKETGKFIFPEKIDMGPYVENMSTAGNTEYELFSVVIHSGGAHGGHYTAYIRDIDSLGQWIHPDDEGIVLSPDPAAGRLDVIECDSPANLVTTILGKCPDKGMSIDKLCQEITQRTGVSWNKRFKNRHGPINKFLKKHDDKFVITPMNFVHIQEEPQSTLLLDNVNDGKPNSNQPTETTHTKRHHRPQTPPPPDGKCWFFFNDSRVHPVRTKELENQFSGKSCAYMLFYRRTDLLRPPEAKCRPEYKVPMELITQVIQDNESLQEKRTEYETKMNTIVIRLIFPQFLTFCRGAVQTRDDTLSYVELAIDQRRPVREILNLIEETYGELMPGKSVVHFVKKLPAGIHIYHCISDQASERVCDTAIKDGCRLLVWDGMQIEGEELPIGEHMEPIQLCLRYGESEKLAYAFCKFMTIIELRYTIFKITGYELESSVISRVINKGENTSLRKILPEDDDRTLQELNFQDGETLLVEHTSRPNSRALVEKVSEKEVSDDVPLTFVIENRCVEPINGEAPLICVTVPKDASVGELKVTVLSQLPDSFMEGCPCRLRAEDNNFGLLPPVSESMELCRADFKSGSRIVLEPGNAPDSDEIFLTFNPDPHSAVILELIVGSGITVRDLVERMVGKSRKNDSEWHVSRTNWCGEACDVLDDLDAILAQCPLKHGDHLLLQPGHLPPKGHLQLFVELHPYAACDKKQASILTNMVHFCAEGVKNLMGSRYSTEDNIALPLGNVVISKESNLRELKKQILTLPELSDIVINSPDFLRVRVVEQNKLSVVLKDSNETLQRLKLSSGMTLGLQILPEEEKLSNFEMLLNLLVRIPGTFTYKPVTEMIWETSQGPTPANLRQAIADHLSQSVDTLAIGLHIPNKYEWTPIVEAPNKAIKQAASGKKKGQSKVKINLKHAPYHMKDGAVIGVKNLEFDPLNEDDFTTKSDLEGREKLKREAEERKKRREELRKANENMNCVGPVPRKESSIKIHVQNFS